MQELACRRCGVVAEPALGWRLASNGTLHLGAYCPACEAWIKWVPQKNAEGGPSEWMADAPAVPEQGALL